VRTDIAGFLGFAERGPLVDPNETDPGKRVQAAVKLTSWNDFRLIFGGFLPYGYLAYAVRGFFASGGETCYVVRVGVDATPPATAFISLPAAPPAASAITLIAAQTSSGQTQLKVQSSEVVDVGDLIAIGDALSGECVSVMSIVDDQTITVQSPILSQHVVNDAVYPMTGSALTAASAKDAVSLQLLNVAGIFAPGDLVSIESNGVSELRAVVSVTAASSTIQLGLPLQFVHDKGAVVRKHTAALRVNAYSPGAWGNRIKLEITSLDTGYAATHFSLRVTVDQGADPAQPQQQEFYPLLSLDPNDPSPSHIYAPDVVNQASQLIQICPGAENCPGLIPQGTFLLVNVGPLQSGDLYLEGGSDGTPAAGAPVVTPATQNPCRPATAAPQAVSASPYPKPPNATNQDFFDALDVLGLVDEVAILCCPDAAGPPPQTPAANPWSMTAIQQAMVEQCVTLQYRVAVLDTPQFQAGNTAVQSDGSPSAKTAVAPLALQPAGAVNWLNGQYSDPSARFAAVYYPWLKVPDNLGIEGVNRTVPPCGHVAGAYAYTDNNFGVQKPPANVQLHFVSDVQIPVTNQQQAFLNPAGINAIREFPGRGIRVWGARSVSSDPDWVYIHTRRLMSMIEDSVEQASRWVVFQTNDDDLRRMLTHSLNVFMESIWLTGGLKGARATDGYFVKCDSTNNTQTTIDAGQLICQVGVAIAAPMEFLVFELRRSVAGAQVVEA
jgi:phage tail sheath protein FI